MNNVSQRIVGAEDLGEAEPLWSSVIQKDRVGCLCISLRSQDNALN